MSTRPLARSTKLATHGCSRTSPSSCSVGNRIRRASVERQHRHDLGAIPSRRSAFHRARSQTATRSASGIMDLQVAAQRRGEAELAHVGSRVPRQSSFNRSSRNRRERSEKSSARGRAEAPDAHMAMSTRPETRPSPTRRTDFLHSGPRSCTERDHGRQALALAR